MKLESLDTVCQTINEIQSLTKEVERSVAAYGNHPRIREGITALANHFYLLSNALCSMSQEGPGETAPGETHE